MKIRYVLLVAVFVLAFSGYGETGSANDLNAFAKACGSAYNLGDPICECLAKKADERLTPHGFAFLVATMNKDDAKAKKLRSKLDVKEAMDAGMFMVNTPSECGEEVGGN